jgi:phosphatidylinositol glycan class M
MIAGACHGVAIHSKLYPIIYTLSFMAYLSCQNTANPTTLSSTNFPWTNPRRLWRLIGIWISRLLTPVPLLFLVSSLVTFAGLTYLGVHWYGEQALQEGLLYHFSRVDHRHNYSMYWYWIYLARARLSTNLAMMGRLLLLPQLVLLVYSSLGLAPLDLGLALFVQTYLFVTHNKVITAQYFTWYLCLLPLCTHSLQMTRRVQVSVMLLLLSIGIWLGSAYCLEMQGMAVHQWVWWASVLYFVANVNLMGAILRSHVDRRDQNRDSIQDSASKKMD